MAKQNKKSIFVSTWSNSTHNNETGAGFGIRIYHSDIDRVINWQRILIDNEILLRGNKTFNEDCPEIRSKMIGAFLIRNGLHIWPRGNPHQLILTSEGRNTFRLHA